MSKVHNQFRLSDFLSDDRAVTADEWNYIGAYEVGVTEQIMLGYGPYDDIEKNPGRIYGELKDDTDTEMSGLVKFEIRDAQGTVLESRVAEFTTDLLNQGLNDQTIRTVFKETGVFADRERQIAMLFKPDSSGTLSLDNSTLIASITRNSL